MWRFDAAIAGLGCVCVVVLGAGRASAGDPASAGRKIVVGSVGDEPIYAGDVARLLGEAAGGKEISPAALPVFQAQVLAEIVDRRLVLAYARRTKSGASPAQVDEAFGRLKSRLASQGRALGDYLQQRAITEADLRRQIAWKLTWPKYLARYVTETRLASFFEAHRREFDGTEVSVSHLLLRPRPGGDSAAIADLVKRAEAIRQEIVSGRIAFAEAARKYSAAPSGKDGGHLGFIARRGAMVESFSRAAFGLDVGEVSRPVTTRFGVHLICCNEIKPGGKEMADVREPLEEALAGELLRKLARLEQRHTPLEFTGAGPYFKPGTRELVVP